jgi:CDP-diacylglycerol--glycerol-3-phosphate 3-phosphatidyltransferase
LDKLKLAGELMTKHIANILTGCRIFGSILLLFFSPFSPEFYITYVLCGFSDMIDGAIARKTNSTSQFGSQLDTIADFIFVVVSLFKLLPAIHVPPWLWLWGGVIAFIKTNSIILGYVSKKQFVALHTIMNKVTGLLLFLWPLTISFAELKWIAIAVCSVATLSAIQEVFYVISDSNPK